MTGQVKEEILTRFGELGARVGDGRIRFEPRLLRRREFGDTPGRLRYLDVGGAWREIPLPAHTLAFTWCQVPVTYRLENGAEPAATVVYADGSERRHAPPVLSAEDSASLFRRVGHIREINVSLSPNSLFNDSQ